MGQVIQMVASSTGGAQNAVAAFDVPNDGFIIGVEWAVTALYDTTADAQQWQVGFATTMNGSNDARNVISNCHVGSMTFTAGGSVIAGRDYYSQLPDIPVAAGERIYLHSAASAGVVGTAACSLHFSTNQARPSVRRS